MKNDIRATLDGTRRALHVLGTAAWLTTFTVLAGVAAPRLQAADDKPAPSPAAPAPKPTPAPVVKSLNGLTDAVLLSGGKNVTISTSGNGLTIDAAGGAPSGPAGGVLFGSYPNPQLAANQVVTSVNALRDDVTLAAGANVTITQSGRTLTFAAASGGGALTTDGSLKGQGTTGSPLGIASPLSLNATNNFPALSVAQTGGTPALYVSGDGIGVNSVSDHGHSISAITVDGTAVDARADDGYAFSGTSGDVALYAANSNGNAAYLGAPCCAADLYGDVAILGTISKSAGSFKIDHPLDPANKYLSHSFVESPDMMNIYNGLVTLDAFGGATVRLPDWFEALNADFRYQLTCIGGFAPVYVARKIAGNTFQIAGGRPGIEVSWQVTGVRHDAYAAAHRIPVEEVKPEAERGTYQYPELHGAGRDAGVRFARHEGKRARKAEAR